MRGAEAGTLHLQSGAGVPVYHITSRPAQWGVETGVRRPRTGGGRARTRRRGQPSSGASLNGNAPTHSVQLLHDLSFPGACHRIRNTPAGTHLVAVGTYPPQVRVYEYAELGLKFERHLDAVACDVLVLEDDWRKLAMLRVDRVLEFHSQYGRHATVRIPTPGRALALHATTCDLYVAAAGSQVYRLNLDEGRFLPPLHTVSESNECIALSTARSMVVCGGSGGAVEAFDPRTEPHRRAAQWPVAADATGSDADAVTAVDLSGLQLLCGTQSGWALLYDIRARAPLAKRRMGYGVPVVSATFRHSTHGETRSATQAVLADRKCVKIWEQPERLAEAPLAAFEPPADIHHVETQFGGAGLILAACEDQPVHAYYLPSLGPAPKWCAFLDHMTEELADGGAGRSAGAATDAAAAAGTVYEHYKFVTRAELAALGLNEALGTEQLRPCLHGFLMDVRAYRKAKSAAEPYAYEEWRQARLQEKLEQQREQRIRQRNAGAKRKPAETDERFAARWTHADYAVREDHERWRHLHPTASVRHRRERDSDEESDENEEDGEGEEVEEEEDDDDDALAAEAARLLRERERAARQRSSNALQSRRSSVTRNASASRERAKAGQAADAPPTDSTGWSVDERELPLQARLALRAQRAASTRRKHSAGVCALDVTLP